MSLNCRSALTCFVSADQISGGSTNEMFAWWCSNSRKDSRLIGSNLELLSHQAILFIKPGHPRDRPKMISMWVMVVVVVADCPTRVSESPIMSN